MATINTSSAFISYNLSAPEALQAAILTGPQKQHVQNLISAYAHDKLQLKYDTKDPMNSIQIEATLIGQIGVLQYLLELSATAEAATISGQLPDA